MILKSNKLLKSKAFLLICRKSIWQQNQMWTCWKATYTLSLPKLVWISTFCWKIYECVWSQRAAPDPTGDFTKYIIHAKFWLFKLRKEKPKSNKNQNKQTNHLTFETYRAQEFGDPKIVLHRMSSPFFFLFPFFSQRIFPNLLTLFFFSLPSSSKILLF